MSSMWKTSLKLFTVIVLAVILALPFDGKAFAQSGAICGQLQKASGLDKFPLFVPYNSNEAWMFDSLAREPLVSLLNGWPSNWGGQYVRVWDPVLGGDEPGSWVGNFAKARWFYNVSRWEFVPACEPTINFTADRGTIVRGECTTLRWNAQNVEAIYLNGNGVAGYGTQAVCPTVNTTYSLRVITYIGEMSRTVVTNVTAPAPVPIPVPTPIRPIATPLSPPASIPLVEPSVRISSNVNLRSGPGTNFSTIGSASAGTSMRITGKNPAGDWWQVCCYQGRSVWVASRVVTALGPLEGVGVIDGEGTRSGTTPQFWEPVSGIGEGIKDQVGSIAHKGVDEFALDYVYESEGVDVYPALPGRVVYSDCASAYGCTVVIRHWDDSKWDRKYYSVYAHLWEKSWRAAFGENVDGTKPIGKMGKSGSGSNGIVHLHFAVRSSDEVMELTDALFGINQKAFNVRPYFLNEANARAVPQSSTPLLSPGATPQPTTGGPGSSQSPLSGFESWGTWKRGQQTWGTFSQSREQTYSGSYAGKIEYDFPAVGDNYVVFLQTISIPGQPSALDIWVYGNGSTNFLNAWVKDAYGQGWQFTFGRVNHTGWQKMTAILDPNAGWPNGSLDGQSGGPRYPLSFQALVLDGYDESKPLKGTIYVDELTAR